MPAVSTPVKSPQRKPIQLINVTINITTRPSIIKLITVPCHLNESSEATMNTNARDKIDLRIVMFVSPKRGDD